MSRTFFLYETLGCLPRSGGQVPSSRYRLQGTGFMLKHFRFNFIWDLSGLSVEHHLVVDTSVLPGRAGSAAGLGPELGGTRGGGFLGGQVGSR